MQKYTFIQGLLLGICIWGAISIGLRYVHYAYNIRIPREMLAPGKVLMPALTPQETELWKKQVEALKREKLLKSDNPEWELVKEWIGTLANLVTIATPLASGALSIVIFRRQRALLPQPKRKPKRRKPED